MERVGPKGEKAGGRGRTALSCGCALLLFLGTMGFLVFGYVYYVKLGR